MLQTHFYQRQTVFYIKNAYMYTSTIHMHKYIHVLIA